ncbi:MAG: hypothetical protein QG657_4572 [Acidobacteriota bacterium]|nr:hypothetical protein [Acidobacteriota bacterium]
MSFNILYIEDNPKDWKRLQNAIDEHNRMSLPEKITLNWAKDTVELEKILDHTIDIILADMFLTPSPYDKGDRLRDVINIVNRWCDKNEAGRPIPVIAYTVGGEDAFKNKNDLYDIWDKNTTSVEYVTWRLSNLSKELTRIRPDALIQIKIRTEIDKANAVSWHGDVLDMIKRYDKGWTEADQIERTGKAIENIAQRLNVWASIRPMWNVVKNGEFLWRAVSPYARGHARHAINVFWFGYYLLHQEPLRIFFIEKWGDLLAERSKMSAVKREDVFESIHNVWFYTGLFHDMALCLEKFTEISEFHRDLFSSFKELELNIQNIPDISTDGIEDRARKLLNEFNDPLATQLKDAWGKKLKDKKVDHGMLAALNLIQTITDKKQNALAREAARAIAIHSLIWRLGKDKIANLTWETEPFACLLLLCDQLQTWARERGDRKLSDNDGPERAELSELEIGVKDNHPLLKISIDYIAPSHLKHAPEIYERVKDELDFILRDNPGRAINRISGWPFSLKVNFSLSKDPLNAYIDIPM